MKKIKAARTIDHARVAVLKVGFSDPTYINCTIEHGTMVPVEGKPDRFEAITSDGYAIFASNAEDWADVREAVQDLTAAVERVLERRGKL